MKKVLHKADSRGAADLGWLQSFHTFSFSSYYNPERIHFGSLRVLNDDYIAPSRGFGTHPHDNMEIVTVMLSGALRHEDSMGNKFVIKRGEVQRMSAGTGITHLEMNHLDNEEVNLLQLWVLPKTKNIKPSYGQKYFPESQRVNKFQYIVAPDEREGSIGINQDAYFLLGQFEPGQSIEYAIHLHKNGAYFFIIEGDVDISGERLSRRDALGVWDTSSVKINVLSKAEILVVDVPV